MEGATEGDRVNSNMDYETDRREIELAHIQRVWGDHYRCWLEGRLFVGEHIESGARVCAPTSVDLLEEIEEDYYVRKSLTAPI